MAAKKKILKVQPFDDILIVGISSTNRDYKLAWYLNQSLHLELVKLEGLNFNSDNNLFSFYYYDEGDNMNIYNLVSNVNEGVRMAKLANKTDYLLIIRNAMSETRLQELLSGIRNIPQVVHAFVIDVEQNRQIEIVLEQIEFHEFKLIKEKNRRLDK